MMNERLENTWVLLSSKSAKYMIWRKFSELKPIIQKGHHTIEYLDKCYEVYLDQICDPKTLKTEIDDVFTLKISTPIELFEELCRRNLLAFDKNENGNSICVSSKQSNSGNISLDTSFDNSAFDVKMPDVSFPSYNLNSFN